MAFVGAYSIGLALASDYFSPDQSDDLAPQEMDGPDDHIKWEFIRGIFDGVGNIEPCTQHPRCVIRTPRACVLDSISAFCGIPHIRTEGAIQWDETNCIDFLGKIYATSNASTRDNTKYAWYVALLNPWSHPWNCAGWSNLPECVVHRVHPDSVMPSKAKTSDAGYDVAVILEARRLTPTTMLYDTGLKIRVPNGFYVEIVPRSSLSKSGYILANSVGVIDRSYTGNVMVALTKIDPEAPEITLPFRCVQIIVRQQVHVHMADAKRGDAIASTTRGEGGFGSSG